MRSSTPGTRPPRLLSRWGFAWLFAWALGISGSSMAASIDLLEIDPARTVLETRFYHFGVRHHEPLVSGWGGSERDIRAHVRFNWALERIARFRFVAFEPVETQALVKVRPMRGTHPQRLTVRVGDREVARLTLTAGFREYRFVIPADAIRPGENEIVFDHAKVARSTPGDPRTFAAAYVYLLLGPNCLPLRPDGFPAQPTVSRQAATEILGPASVEYRVVLPPRARLSAELSLPEDEDGPARVSIEVGDAGTWTQVATARLEGGWLGTPSATLDVDLARYAGQRASVRLRVEPETCENATVRVRVKRAMVLGGNGGAFDRAPAGR